MGVVSPAVLPKWGMITTSRVVEDVVSLLTDRGVDEIVIGEGPVISDPKNKEKAARLLDGLGYNTLKRRYGVKCLNIFERPFEKVDLGEGVVLNVNIDILNSDFVINIPVLKTHAQTVVSLGVKNLKGVIDIESRKKCHSVDMEKDLHYMIARLANKLPILLPFWTVSIPMKGGRFLLVRLGGVIFWWRQAIFSRPT